MKPKPEPELFTLQSEPDSRKRVIRVDIYKRSDSSVYQALIQFGPAKIRLSTHSRMSTSAKEFADLTFRYYSNRIREGRVDCLLTWPEKMAIGRLSNNSTEVDHKAIARIARKLPGILMYPPGCSVALTEDGRFLAKAIFES